MTMYSPADSEKELKLMEQLLTARASLVQTGCDIVEKNMVESWVTKLDVMKNVDLTASMSLYEAINASALNDGIKKTMIEAVDNKVSGIKNTIAANVKPQLLVHILNYLTTTDWDKLNDVSVQLQSKVMCIVLRLVRLGVRSLHEQTCKWVVAALLHLLYKSTNQWLDAKSTFELVKEVKKSLQQLNQPYPHGFILTYPEFPSQLNDDVFKYAYPCDDDGPITVVVENFASMGSYVPLRSSSALLKHVGCHLQLTQGPTPGSMTSMPQDFFQQFMSMMQGQMRQGNAELVKERLGDIRMGYATKPVVDPPMIANVPESASGAASSHQGHVPAREHLYSASGSATRLPIAIENGSTMRLPIAYATSPSPSMGTIGASPSPASTVLKVQEVSENDAALIDANAAVTSASLEQSTFEALKKRKADQAATAKDKRIQKKAQDKAASPKPKASKSPPKASLKASPKASPKVSTKASAKTLVELPKCAAKLDWKPSWPATQPSCKNVFTSYAYCRAKGMARKADASAADCSALAKAAYAIAASLWDKKAE